MASTGLAPLKRFRDSSHKGEDIFGARDQHQDEDDLFTQIKKQSYMKEKLIRK
jgi:hypothetical protein